MKPGDRDTLPNGIEMEMCPHYVIELFEHPYTPTGEKVTRMIMRWHVACSKCHPGVEAKLKLTGLDPEDLKRVGDEIAEIRDSVPGIHDPATTERCKHGWFSKETPCSVCVRGTPVEGSPVPSSPTVIAPTPAPVITGGYVPDAPPTPQPVDRAEAIKRGGYKDDQQKPRTDLLPFDALLDVADVLRYGAIKYTKRGACTCHVRRDHDYRSALTAEDRARARSAEIRTRRSFGSGSLTTPSDSESRVSHGGDRTQNESRNRPENDGNASGTIQSSNGNDGTAGSRRSTGSRTSRSMRSTLPDVRSAEDSIDFTSTTNTEPDEFEDASATPVTSGSASWSDRVPGLNEHSPTCGVHRIERQGERNWEGGMDWGRLLGAAIRHLFAWGKGEDTDPESGKHHLAHAATCILMLLASVKRKIGADDRNRHVEVYSAMPPTPTPPTRDFQLPEAKRYCYGCGAPLGKEHSLSCRFGPGTVLEQITVISFSPSFAVAGGPPVEPGHLASERLPLRTGRCSYCGVLPPELHMPWCQRKPGT